MKTRNRLKRYFLSKTMRAMTLYCRVKRRAEAVEKLMDGVAEFVIPSQAQILDGDQHVRLYLELAFDKTDMDDDLQAFAREQLREMSVRLAEAADRLGGEA